MPNTLTATPVAPGPTTPIPADTENVDSASIAQFVQPMINADAYLSSKILASGANIRNLPVAITRAYYVSGGGWAPLSLGPPGVPVLNTTTSSSSVFLLPIDGIASVGVFLRTYEMRFLGASGHSALPATMPKLEIISIPDSLGATVGTMTGASILHTTVDSTVNVTAYQEVHRVEGVVGFDIDISDPTQEFFVRVTSESGANASGGLSAWNLVLGVSA